MATIQTIAVLSEPNSWKDWLMIYMGELNVSIYIAFDFIFSLVS